VLPDSQGAYWRLQILFTNNGKAQGVGVNVLIRTTVAPLCLEIFGFFIQTVFKRLKRI
jgi:hypothetical protein